MTYGKSTGNSKSSKDEKELFLEFVFVFPIKMDCLLQGNRTTNDITWFLSLHLSQLVLNVPSD
jgi:hypothetical protein